MRGIGCNKDLFDGMMHTVQYGGEARSDRATGSSKQ